MTIYHLMKNIRILLVIYVVMAPMLSNAAEPMKLVYYDSYQPRSWNDNGVMKGMLIDIINEAITNRMNIPVTHEGYPWKRAQARVKRGKADAFVTVPSAERGQYTVFSNEPVIEFTLNILTRKNHPRLNTLKQVTTVSELQNYTLVDYLGNGWAKENLQEMKVHWLPDADKIFSFLHAGRADCIISSKRSIYDMKRLGYADDLIILPNKLRTVSFHLCIRKTSEYCHILREFDQIMTEMKADGTIKKLEESYY